jgi:phosphotransacetylase
VQALDTGARGNEDLLAPVAAPESGLRGERRLSHAFFVDMPGRAQGLLVADALLNVSPNLAAKKDIVANTVELAYALGVVAPLVAVIAATDVVTPAFASTADAVALKTMAMRGMFRDARVDGPLTVDTALSADAARAAHSTSEIAGNADVLIAPGMETASVLVRTLVALTGGLAAGLVVGAKVPVIAPARNDPIEVRMASCVLAALAVQTAAAPAANNGPVTTGGPITVNSRVAA